MSNDVDIKKQALNNINVAFNQPPRDVNRIPEMLDALGQVWMKYPDMRLGQLIENAYSKALPFIHSNPDLFMMEDDVMLFGLRRLRDEP